MTMLQYNMILTHTYNIRQHRRPVIHIPLAGNLTNTEHKFGLVCVNSQ